MCWYSKYYIIYSQMGWKCLDELFCYSVSILSATNGKWAWQMKFQHRVVLRHVMSYLTYTKSYIANSVKSLDGLFEQIHERPRPNDLSSPCSISILMGWLYTSYIEFALSDLYKEFALSKLMYRSSRTLMVRVSIHVTQLFRHVWIFACYFTGFREN